MPPLPTVIHHTFAEGVEDWLLHDPMAQRVQWLGREALMLGGGGANLAPVAPKPPYTIKATLSGGPAECYVGFCFHLAEAGNFETLYLSPHLGGQPEAIQYDPVINGSNTWQVFCDADSIAAVPLQKERWHVLRANVWPDIAQVYVDDEGSPRATFPLRLGARQGRAGLWAYLPSYIADFELRPLEAAPPTRPKPKVVVPSGTIREWLVAGYDSGSRVALEPRLLNTEHNGTLCLNRRYRAEPEAQAFAACEIEIPSGSQQVALEVGYSDRARVWLDKALVHEGEWRWDSAAGTDGRIRPGHVKVPIPAASGSRLLLTEVAVAEPGFGWGLTARVVADGKPCQWRPASRVRFPGDL
jgi:hypothetical protein